MARVRRTYSDEFKMEAIRLHEESGRPVRQLEKELGLSSGLLRLWLQKSQQSGEAGLQSAGSATASDLRVRELERENQRLRQERDILKKALAIFSRPEG